MTNTSIDKFNFHSGLGFLLTWAGSSCVGTFFMVTLIITKSEWINESHFFLWHICTYYMGMMMTRGVILLFIWITVLLRNFFEIKDKKIIYAKNSTEFLQWFFGWIFWTHFFLVLVFYFSNRLPEAKLTEQKIIYKISYKILLLHGFGFWEMIFFYTTKYFYCAFFLIFQKWHFLEKNIIENNKIIKNYRQKNSNGGFVQCLVFQIWPFKKSKKGKKSENF